MARTATQKDYALTPASPARVVVADVPAEPGPLGVGFDRDGLAWQRVDDTMPTRAEFPSLVSVGCPGRGATAVDPGRDVVADARRRARPDHHPHGGHPGRDVGDRAGCGRPMSVAVPAQTFCTASVGEWSTGEEPPVGTKAFVGAASGQPDAYGRTPERIDFERTPLGWRETFHGRTRLLTWEQVQFWAPLKIRHWGRPAGGDR